ncbi:DUF488 domain-containing protein [Brevibacterium marinum]|uniref:Uncharacterized protein YeaO (DUF488 family) n=1 Tax=Brevibacterium marinum TaxID=418643 RepID=A0A846RNV1_9MICO|nr:DUF488 family protein [Brevibacterium marinum]NJC55574.1 uncharacterized protein YeaO (DUF488 family) [Brevibacterium marinum]
MAARAQQGQGPARRLAEGSRAPSSDLRKWYSHDPDKFDEFSKRYREELKDDDHAEALEQLKDYAKKGKLTLLTASKRDDISDATVLKKVLDGK